MSDEETRYCSWHKVDHPVGEFKGKQRYCVIGMREYQRFRRGASEEAARADDWRQGVRHKESG